MARPHGTKYIDSPEQLWELFCKYKEHEKATPMRVMDFVGKDGKLVYRDKEAPLTMESFKAFCWEKISTLQDYFSNRDKRYSDYVEICSRIYNEIRADQIKGGMTGVYNPSITQRLNGLKEQVEQTNIEQPLFPDVKENDSDK